MKLRPTAELVEFVDRTMRRQLWRGELMNEADYRFARQYGRVPNNIERQQLRELELLDMPTAMQADANAIRYLTTRK